MLNVDELKKAAERDDSHDVTDDDRSSSAAAWDNACKYSDYKTMFVIMMSKNLAYGRRIEARDAAILELLTKLSAAEHENWELTGMIASVRALCHINEDGDAPMTVEFCWEQIHQAKDYIDGIETKLKAAEERVGELLKMLTAQAEGAASQTYRNIELVDRIGVLEKAAMKLAMLGIHKSEIWQSCKVCKTDAINTVGSDIPHKPDCPVGIIMEAKQ